MRILLVDDHRDTLRALSMLLGWRGHDITIAQTLATALALCENGKFDIILSDLQLPDGDGCDLAELAQRCGIKAIALTGYGSPADIARTQKAGFVAHLLKPVTLEAIEQAIETASNSPANRTRPAQKSFSLATKYGSASPRAGCASP